MIEKEIRGNDLLTLKQGSHIQMYVDGDTIVEGPLVFALPHENGGIHVAVGSIGDEFNQIRFFVRDEDFLYVFPEASADV